MPNSATHTEDLGMVLVTFQNVYLPKEWIEFVILTQAGILVEQILIKVMLQFVNVEALHVSYETSRSIEWIGFPK